MNKCKGQYLSVRSNTPAPCTQQKMIKIHTGYFSSNYYPVKQNLAPLLSSLRTTNTT